MHPLKLTATPQASVTMGLGTLLRQIDDAQAAMSQRHRLQRAGRSALLVVLSTRLLLFRPPGRVGRLARRRPARVDIRRRDRHSGTVLGRSVFDLALGHGASSMRIDPLTRRAAGQTDARTT